MAFVSSVVVRPCLVEGKDHWMRSEQKKRMKAAKVPCFSRASSLRNKWMMCSPRTTEDGTSAGSPSPSSQSTPTATGVNTVESEEDSTPHDEGILDTIANLPKQRYAVGVLYVAFVVYAFLFAPGAIGSSPQIDALLSLNLENVNPLYFSIFNILGSTGINYAVALNGGASRQPQWLPNRFFTLFSVLTGWLAAGPYVTLRRYVPQVSAKEVRSFGFLSRIFESRWFSLGNLVLCAYSYAYAFGLFVAGSETLHDLMFFSSLVDLTRLVQIDRVVNVSCVDFVILSVLFWGPLTEDMRRRGWFAPGKNVESFLTAAIIMSTPGLGPSLYFVLRPSLPEDQNKLKSDKIN